MERTRVERQSITLKEWTQYFNYDICYMDKQEDKWSRPISISSIINNDNLQSEATFTNDGTVYYLSYLKGVEQECGIFKSKFKNGEYLPPDTLPTYINSQSQDWTPYISPDDSYIIFSSNRNNSNDPGDLYISFHDIKLDKWFEPINLGEPINTWAHERFPTVSPDGKYLFFTRWTKENTYDVFWVSSKIIDELKKEVFNSKVAK
jgi:hypothetical protein